MPYVRVPLFPCHCCLNRSCLVCRMMRLPCQCCGCCDYCSVVVLLLPRQCCCCFSNTFTNAAFETTAYISVFFLLQLWLLGLLPCYCCPHAAAPLLWLLQWITLLLLRCYDYSWCNRWSNCLFRFSASTVDAVAVDGHYEILGSPWLLLLPYLYYLHCLLQLK
jgi:hypothetical protein